MSKCGLDECDLYGGCLHNCDYGKEKKMPDSLIDYVCKLRRVYYEDSPRAVFRQGSIIPYEEAVTLITVDKAYYEYLEKLHKSVGEWPNGK